MLAFESLSVAAERGIKISQRFPFDANPLFHARDGIIPGGQVSEFGGDNQRAIAVFRTGPQAREEIRSFLPLVDQDREWVIERFFGSLGHDVYASIPARVSCPRFLKIICANGKLSLLHMSFLALIFLPEFFDIRK